jgi:NAD+ synthase (glutamine-hydrolysing)
MKKFNIVAAQMNFLVGDIKGNTQRIIAEAQHANEHLNADLVVFPELALTGYPPEDLLFRPGFYKRCNIVLEEIKAAITNTAVVIGYPEKIGDKAHNAAIVIQNGKIIGHYAKQKLPNYEVFDEVRYFVPGDTACVVDINGVNAGIIICEDCWFTEPAATAVAAGADIIVSPNASPYDKHKVRVREDTLIQRANECKVPFVYVNCVGGQDEIVFDGGSMVISAEGERVQQAAYYREDRMLVEIEINDTLQIIPKKLPKRLSEEENIYQTLVLGVRDYITKNHFPGAIIGLSGGIDSALTLAITVDAIGADRVQTVMMPSRYTSSMSLEDAKTQAELLVVDYQIIEIDTIFECFLEHLAKPFAGLSVDSTEENLQARIRGTLLMALSNKKGSIVLTTGNKSEMSVGYATLYGDMAGGFSVLKDIPKTMVYRLAKYRNLISPVIPERVIERPPSAELAADQKDQDSLPPYPVLDEILERYIEKDQDPHDIYAAGLDKDTVNRVVQMVNHNEYKRRQAPVGIRISQKAFGKDRRYPITSGYGRNI